MFKFGVGLLEKFGKKERKRKKKNEKNAQEK